MNDDKHDDAEAPTGKSRKRAPPTIDLKAASVSESSSEPNATTDRAADQVPPGPSTSAPHPSWRERFGAARASIPWPPFSPRVGGATFAPVFMAAIAGAISALAVLGIAWLVTAKDGSSRIAARMPQSTGASSGKADMESRLAKIETRVSNAATASASSDPALIARLEVLEKSVASLRDDLASVKGRSEATEAAIGDIKAAAPAAPDLAAVEERISKIERATVALTGEIAAPAKPAPEDPRLRRVAAATALDAAVRQGEPYSVALSTAKALAEDTAILKPLDDFAAGGVPSANAMSRELLSLLPKLTPKPESAPVSGGILDRLQQSATGLIRIERTDAVPSATASATARAASAAQRDDVVSARLELNALPASERAPVQAWLDKADAREAALAASRQFASDTMTALSRPAR